MGSMPPCAYQIAEARERFRELVDRAEKGEEILIADGEGPKARLVAPLRPGTRQPGALKALLSEEEIEALLEAVEAPLSPDEQRILEGEGTDGVGIWVGLGQSEQSVPEAHGTVESASRTENAETVPSAGRRVRKLLLDSHTLLWWLMDRSFLSRSAEKAIADGRNTVLISVVNVRELLFKACRGRLPMSGQAVESALRACSLPVLPIAPEHAERAASLAWPHGDPWDRLLAAQALNERATLVSKDGVFDELGIDRLW